MSSLTDNGIGDDGDAFVSSNGYVVGAKSEYIEGSLCKTDA